MNIALLYDKKNNSVEEKINTLKEVTCNSKEIKKYDFRYVNRLGSKVTCDVFLIIADDFEIIQGYESKIKEKEKILIATNNLDAVYIMKCIDITKNICYFKNTPNEILNKIISVYEENRYAIPC